MPHSLKREKELLDAVMKQPLSLAQAVKYFLRRDFEAAWRLFASRLRTEEQPEVLKRKIENRERTAGHFEHFDHVEVSAVYHGPNSRRVPSSPGLWPKGMDKKQRRAETLFELGSFVSPGGAFMTGHRMLLSLVEEEGVLRVACYEMASG